MNNCIIKNNSDLEIENEIHSLVNFTKNMIGFKRPPTIFLNHDKTNSQKILAKTGYYDPETMEIHIYTTGRHPKDILRSIAHELVHHFQNEKGQFNKAGYSGKGYAQKNPHLRKMELQANDPMLFRDWEDSLKQKYPTIYNEWKSIKENTMETKQTLCEPHCATEEDKEEIEELNLTKRHMRRDAAGGEYKDKAAPVRRKLNISKDKEKRDAYNKGKVDVEDPTMEEGAKPDFLDLDKDGDKKEPMKDAAEDAKDKKDNEEKKETTKEWKNRELNENLSKKWGFSMDLSKLKK